MTRGVALACIALALNVQGRTALAAPPTVHERVLPNGVRACYLHHPDAKGVSIFTFLPMGLAGDDAGRTQWAHLVEHLVIRTTVAGQLSNVNAETMPDHMRLDYYGTPGDWREGLSHPARWLKGLPFTEASLRDEPGRANAEVDHTAKVFATHKFATAAWNQVYRHGRDDVALKGDLVSAAADDLRRYCDGRLFVPKRTLVCVIGAEEPGTVLDAVAETAGGIEARAVAEPERPAKLAAGERRATWDADARHLLMTWPIVSPDEDPATFAALSAAARLLWTDVAAVLLGRQCRNALAGTDLRTPEGSHLYLSTALTPKADAAAARQAVVASVAGLRAAPQDALRFGFAKAQLLNEVEVYDPVAMRRLVPPARLSDAMIEAQVALTWGTAEYRLGGARAAYTAALQALTAEQVRQAAARFLTDDRLTVVELRPRDP